MSQKIDYKGEDLLPFVLGESNDVHTSMDAAIQYAVSRALPVR